LVEFLAPEELLGAARAARRAGYREMDAYTPYAVEGLAAELGLRRSQIPSIVLIGGLVGAGAGFGMQYYSMAIDYPVNAGGRPYNSWPAFFPIAFEVSILVAALAGFLGMLFLNGLPQPHHPLFNVPQFARASQDRFFLCIEAIDPLFKLDETTQFLISLRPHGQVLLVPETEPTDDEISGIAVEVLTPINRAAADPLTAKAD
jgi:hypothetical protein